MISPEQRRIFAAAADVLIPAADPMPSATAAGVDGALLDQVLEYRPDLVEPLVAALAECSGPDVPSALDALARDRPREFEALTISAAGAYFLSPAVKAAMPYDGAPRAVHDDVDGYIDLLANVVERGFVIR